MAAARIEFDNAEFTRLQNRLQALPGKLRRGGMRKAVTAGSTQIVRSVRRLVPKGLGQNPDGSKRRHLRQTLAKKIKTYTDSNTVVGIIGHDYKKQSHAHFVHPMPGKGIAVPRHNIAVKKKRVLYSKSQNRFFGRQVIHPGYKGERYIDRGAARAQPATIRAMIAKMKQELPKLEAK